MSDDSLRASIVARVDAKLAGYGTVKGLHGLAVAIAHTYAGLAGDPVTRENEDFWSVAGNIFTAADHSLEPEGDAVAAFINLSKSVATSSFIDEWQATKGIGDRLCNEMDGGEELGFSKDWSDIDWHDAPQRMAALKHGMRFHRVPRRWQTAVADVVSGIMLATPNWWYHEETQLRQPWAQCCCYVTYAIALRVTSREAVSH